MIHGDPPVAAESGGRPRVPARGFALVEAVICVLLVGLLFVSSMQVVAASRTSEAVTAHRAIGRGLALDLMNEILAYAYEEPDVAPLFGREVGEPAGLRAAYDDVDDFHGWSSQPPIAANGAPLAELDGWSRQVQVTFVDPADPQSDVGDDRGVKRIRVTVLRHGKVVATTTALRSIAWVNPLPRPEGVVDNQPPLAIAAADRLVIWAGGTVNFTAGGSSDPDGDVLTFYWDFGDGTGSGGASASRRFSIRGTYTVTLTVSDGSAMDTDHLLVEVR